MENNQRIKQILAQVPFLKLWIVHWIERNERRKIPKLRNSRRDTSNHRNFAPQGRFYWPQKKKKKKGKKKKSVANSIERRRPGSNVETNGKRRQGDGRAKGSCPAGGTKPAEKSISERARQNSVTHGVQFSGARLPEFFSHGMSRRLAFPLGETRIPFVYVQSLQSRAIHQFASLTRRNGGGRRKMSRLWKSRGDETVTCHVPRRRTSFPLARAKWSMRVVFLRRYFLFSPLFLFFFLFQLFLIVHRCLSRFAGHRA